MTTTILVADDHPLFREALKIAVSRVVPDCTLLEACTIAEALQSLDKAPSPSLVLLDLKMPDCTGVEGLIAIRTRYPLTPVAIVSACEEPRQVRRALALGASGYIPKSVSMDVLAAALGAILAGEIWTHSGCHLDDQPLERLDILTPAQMRILIDLQRGRLNKQIAYDIGVTEATVKSHLTAIFRKLGVMNRTQAVMALQSMMDPV